MPYIVNIELVNDTYLPKCTVYTYESDTPVTKKKDIESIFQVMPWGNEVRKFRVQSKHVQAHLNPSLIKKYELIKI